MKVAEVLSSQESLRVLVETKMVARASFKVSLLVKKLEEYVKTYQESREKLIKEFGVESTESPGQFSFVPENQVKFVEQHTSLLDVVVDVNVNKIKADDILGGIEPKHLLMLEWLIEE